MSFTIFALIKSDSNGDLQALMGNIFRPQLARFGEIDESDGMVREFSEKPKASEGLINGGFMVFDRSFLEVLDVEEQCDLETGVLPPLAKDGLSP